jgi:hypothetical protein
MIDFLARRLRIDVTFECGVHASRRIDDGAGRALHRDWLGAVDWPMADGKTRW